MTNFEVILSNGFVRQLCADRMEPDEYGPSIKFFLGDVCFAIVYKPIFVGIVK